MSVKVGHEKYAGMVWHFVADKAHWKDSEPESSVIREGILLHCTIARR